MFLRKNGGGSQGDVLDTGARARMQAKAAQVAASVYRFWDQGITVDVTYADGRVEMDNTLFGIVEDCRLRDGGRYLKTLESQPGRSHRAVVSGDTYVRLVLQPSPNRMIRTFNAGQPTDWIGSIVLVPKSEKKLIGLVRLRSDIPPDRNKKLLERAKRLFIQHSGSVEVRDMLDTEVAEHREMLPTPASRDAENELRLEATPGEPQIESTTAQAEEDHQFETLLRTAGEKSPMPFTEWVSGQTDGHLLTSEPEYLAMRLDAAYGGPGIVDRFFERGLRHIVDDDLGSTCRRVRQWLTVLDIVGRRTESRPGIKKARIDLEKLEQQGKHTIKVDPRLRHSISVNRQNLDQMKHEVLEPIRRQAKYAGELGLTRLERQYLDMITNYPWR